ncbi:chemotaxis protein CheW [Oxalicibacterium flavum]|uniref:Chemotaxis protein CheW n=2 Tax=Oxalicibacterium flavum TaxID=179467 RepID=A0A8J2UMT0_9BURK|nr:chemotaxis protein CheW [Oxalicibacterium flavum]
MGIEAGGEFLSFRIGREEYGIDILKVQEIRGYETVTKVANAPKHVLGVINLRGAIVPIVDLRIKLRQTLVDYASATVVIIVELGDAKTGMVVDGVSDVLTLPPANIKPVPELSFGPHTDFICGLGMIDERMLILIDIEKLLQAETSTVLETQERVSSRIADDGHEATP